MNGTNDDNDTINIMDDETYGHALIQELAALTQELADEKTERDRARVLCGKLRKEREALQLQQNYCDMRNQELQELENLKKQVEQRKREKAHLLRELATIKREYCRLQNNIGLELTFANGHCSELSGLEKSQQNENYTGKGTGGDSTVSSLSAPPRTHSKGELTQYPPINDDIGTEDSSSSDLERASEKSTMPAVASTSRRRSTTRRSRLQNTNQLNNHKQQQQQQQQPPPSYQA